MGDDLANTMPGDTIPRDPKAISISKLYDEQPSVECFDQGEADGLIDDRLDDNGLLSMSVATNLTMRY